MGSERGHQWPKLLSLEQLPYDRQPEAIHVSGKSLMLRLAIYGVLAHLGIPVRTVLQRLHN